MNHSYGSRLALTSVVILLGASLTACVHPKTHYRVIDLGTLSCPNGNCAVGTVNDVCEVAGYEETNGEDWALVWQPTMSGAWVKTVLPPPTLQYAAGSWANKSILSATNFRAFSINNFGEVIGYGKGPRNEAVLWRTRAVPDPAGFGSGQPAVVGAYLGGLPNNGAVSEGFGINNAAQTVGNSKDMIAILASQWSRTSGMSTLGSSLLPTNGVAPSHAVAIDDRGDIAGDATVNLGAAGSTTHAFYWDPTPSSPATTATMLDLGTLPGGQGNSKATAVINPGSFGPVVVGVSTVTGGTHAFSWRPSTGMVDLKDLPGGGEGGGADAVGTAGVFGYGTVAAGKHAVGWPLIDLDQAPKTTAIDLNSLITPPGSMGTVVLEEATGVNGIGIVAVLGTVNTTAQHAFLLVPAADDLPGFFGPSLFSGACGRPAQQ